MRLPVVAIVGRPNVGKSTLFNRMLGRSLAVVDDLPGITRDRLYARVEWTGCSFLLIDTGGWVPEGGDPMDERILAQVFRALDECDLVLFLVDARAGIQPHDREIARHLLRTGRPYLFAANKVDSERIVSDAAEFAALGLGGSPHAISATEGRGIGDLLDEMVARIPRRAPSDTETEAIRIAVLGRPNVGKSSIVNRLLCEDRMIVHETPGTTRDAIDAPLRYHGQEMVIVDTAGIRRHLSAHPDFEFYATLRALRSLESADVAVLVFDASVSLTRQDLRIAKMIEDAGRPCVWAFNKWDLVEKEANTAAHLLEEARHTIAFQSYAPAEFVSALTVQRISRLPERILEVYAGSRQQVATAELNACIRRAIDRYPPRAIKGERPLKVYYATQVRIAPPTVNLFVNKAQRLAASYERYLARELRAAFGFTGSPIRLHVRTSR